ncbi:MAG TPA: 2-phospho-L-lactate guanylyltransferase [Solirubrobacterales bacterium]|nr:2-phospho-L-lactate guanylyltransferase [Solirubrobacterales bacterium]
MNAIAIITAKRFTSAKQRLAGSIDEELRLRLVEAMLGDVLQAVGEARTVSGILVVTGEGIAADLARAAGAEVIHDPEDVSHSGAALLGIARAEELAADCVALLPGDCPLLDPRELDRLLTGLPTPFVTVVPDRHGTGTNALALSPPRAIEPAFGEGSRERHLTLARTAGVPHTTEDLPTLALDLDTPADFVALTTRLEMSPGRAARTAKVLGI